MALFVSPERGVRNAVDLVRVFPEGLEGDRFRVTTAGASTGSTASCLCALRWAYGVCGQDARCCWWTRRRWWKPACRRVA